MTPSPVSGGEQLCQNEPPTAQSAAAVKFPPNVSLGLSWRFALFSLLFAAEGIPISNLVHKSLGVGGVLQIAVLFIPLWLAIGYVKSREIFQQVSAELRNVPLRWGLLAGHFAALLAFLGLSLMHAGNDSLLPGFAGTALWYATGVLTLAYAACAFLPPRAALQLVRHTGWAWLYALAVAVLARRLIVYAPLWNGAVWNPAMDLSWKPVTDLTFGMVNLLLRMLLPYVIADRATMTIGTPGFNVEITPWCAGFEGTALMLVFGVAWLAFFRREYRFPQALLLIPAGMAVIWLSNVARITALILIGVAGAPNIAVNGFHSEAGWIAFTCVALSFAVLSRRWAWVSLEAETVSGARAAGPNPTAPYLMPFVVLMAAGMVSVAASSGFERLYPLQVLAAAVALWFFRSKYRELNWRFGWFAALAGSAIFILWLGLDRLSGAHPDSAIGPGLQNLSGSARFLWLAFRTIGAVVTAPLAEELAFRGFLIRRINSADFESLSPRHYTYFSMLMSSLAFGLLHGDRWIAGSLAGLIYGVAFVRRGRIGDAVFAHALTNALLAAWVMWSGQWYLW
jgi:exosortase E/protease (VPEID-CTERM system)